MKEGDTQVIQYTNRLHHFQWINGGWKRHRVDGPAIIHDDGYMEWHFEGFLHRIDGPAVVSKGFSEFWIDGQWIKSLEEFQEITNISDEELIMLKLKYSSHI